MENLEDKIRIAANRYDNRTINSSLINQSFIDGVLSDEAKEYWQQGMYTEKEVKILLGKLFFNEIYPDYTTTWEQEDLDKWFIQNKKSNNGG